MDFWQTILFSFGGSAVFLTATGFIAKSIIELFITRDIKRFEIELRAKSDAAIEHIKSDLKAKSDVAIENLQNDLQHKLIEHKKKFSRLHEKRAIVIAELYGHMVEMLGEAENFFSIMQFDGEPNMLEKRKIAVNKIIEFYDYFNKNRIYFPEDLCVFTKEFAAKIRNLITELGYLILIDEDVMNEKDRENRDNTWIKGFKLIQTEVPIARKILENRFRALLGRDS